MGKELKMKLLATFASLAVASKCLDEPTEIDQVKCFTKELSTSLDIFKAPIGPPDGCVKEFLERCIYCVENVQLESPFCLEDNPNFNGIMCAIQLNICLVNQLDGIAEFCRPQ